MIEPQLLLAYAMIWSGIIIAATPITHGQEIGAIVFALGVGVMVALWKSETTKFNKRAFCGDMIACGLGGFTVSTIGISLFVAIANHFLKKYFGEEVQIQFDINNNTRMVWLIAAFSGLFSTTLFRWVAIKKFPNLLGFNDGTRTESP